MNIRSRWLLLRPPAAALAMVAGLVWMGAPAAHAQLFGWDPALPPAQIERMIQASGYRLTGPVVRRGAVYLADVVGRNEGPERLIIDAREGRLLQRFPAAAVRREAAAGWSAPPQDSGSLFGWLNGEDDEAAPRPPAGLDGGAMGQPLRVAPLHAPPVKEATRGDDATAPHVILGPNFDQTGSMHVPSPLLEKPKLRPLVRRKRPELAPVVQPAAVPGNAAPTAGAVGTGQPAPHCALTKAASGPTAPVAPAAAVAPTHKAPAVKPALNDVPVAPLE